MTKNKKYLAAAAVICMAAGAVIGGIGLGLGGLPGFYINASGVHSYNIDKKSDDGKVLEKTRLDAFTSMQMNIPNANVYIVPSDDYYIEYRLESQTGNIDYHVEDNTLVMKVNDYSGLQFFSFNIFGQTQENYVKLYLPEDQIYDSLYVDAGMGDVSLGNIKAKSIELNLSLGDLTGDIVESDRFTAVLDNGSFYVGVCNTQNLSVENDLGDIAIDSLEIGSQGNIELNLGNLDIKYCSFNRLDINNSLGNVKMCLKGTEDDYQMDLQTDLGTISVPDSYGINEDDSSRFISQNENGAILNVYNDCGDITVEFVE